MYQNLIVLEEYTMDMIRCGVTVLMKSAVTGQRLALPEGFSLQEAMELIAQHQLIPLAYAGAVNCGIDRKDPVMTALLSRCLQYALISEKQLAALRKLYRVLDEHNIDYLPLKGCNMKFRYPKPELRTMGDADILIRVEQYPEVVPLLEELGFSFVVESDHEFVWRSKSLYLELHKRLIPSYNQDYAAYFQDGWQMAHPCGGSRFEMTPEDEFLFQFVHFAKHYRGGGIGCRHILDLYVFLRYFPELDCSYVERELEKLKLLEFYRNIRRLLEFWFQDGDSDPVVEHISAYIFASGNFGTMKNHILAQQVRSSEYGKSLRFVKTRAWLRAIFPKMQSLEYAYPILKRHRWMVPFVWGWRLCKCICSFRKKFRYQATRIGMMDVENVTDFRDALRYVGLDFRLDT